MRRPESRFPLFRKRIPQDVLPKLQGRTLTIQVGDTSVPCRITEKTREIKVSLRTAEPGEAKERQADISAQLERQWRAIRNGPQRLTQKQVVSLAGEIYGLVVDRYEDDPETPERWDAVIEGNRLAKEGRWPIHIGSTDAQIRNAYEHTFGPLADLVLSRRGLEIDDDSRDRLLRRTGDLLDRAAERLKRNAEGDYSPDEVRKGFPSWTSAAPKRAAPAANTQARVSLQKLLDDWWTEAKALGLSGATRESYSHAVGKFRKHLKHDDAARVTPEDVIAFKDARLKEVNPRTGKVVSPKTVKDSDLAGLKTVFGWGVRNRRIETNPAEGVTVKLPRAARKRSKSFSDEEARLILDLSLAYRPGRRERPTLAAAKRWVPWLCAYTGARVGEMVQLRKQDVRRDAGGWYIRITPDAGWVKDKDMRDVPLHPHLIEQGFIEFVEGAPDDRLFVTPDKVGDITASWRTTKTRLAEFARKVVPDPDVQPNHAWRHRFVTEGRRVGVPERVLHEITGHAPSNVGEAYGEVPMSTMREGVERFPGYWQYYSVSA
ncbi:integrase [Amorphus orientalis]|uniref:Integrase n=1 Tax=Amorphus orientalis TaxID=649198 RepID=A0AAE4AQ58_9HYPH|nr:integrase [Amorphus orientalis]